MLSRILSNISFSLAVSIVLGAASVAVAQGPWTLDTVVSAGGDCFGVAVTPDGREILVTNKDTSGTLTVLSASDYSILARIPMYGDYPAGIAVRPNGATAMVTCGNPNAVRVVDLHGDSVIAAFYPPCSATTLYDIAITPDGLTAVMPDLSDQCVAEGVRWFDATTKVGGSTFVSANTTGVTYGIAVSPDTVTVLVTTFNLTSVIKRINLATSSVRNIFGIGPSYGVAVTHKGDRAVVTSDSVKVISMADGSVMAAIPFQSNTSFKNVAITPDDRYAFVVGNFDVAVISLEGDSVVQAFSASGQNVAVSPDGMHAYVTDSYNGEVRVYKYNEGTGIGKNPFGPPVPGTVNLRQNYPNPFNPVTVIEYSVPTAGFVTLRVYDILGKPVRTLVEGVRSPGDYRVTFSGAGLPSGVYFYRLTAASSDGHRFSSVRKLILTK